MNQDNQPKPVPDTNPFKPFLTHQGTTTHEGQINAGLWERQTFPHQPQSGQQPHESNGDYLKRINGG